MQYIVVAFPFSYLCFIPLFISPSSFKYYTFKSSFSAKQTLMVRVYVVTGALPPDFGAISGNSRARKILCSHFKALLLEDPIITAFYKTKQFLKKWFHMGAQSLVRK